MKIKIKPINIYIKLGISERDIRIIKFKYLPIQEIQFNRFKLKKVNISQILKKVTIDNTSVHISKNIGVLNYINHKYIYGVMIDSYILLVVQPQMFRQKSTQCVHKITRFQAHKGCSMLASVCEQSCQNLHGGDVMVMSVEAVDDHFKSIRELLIKQIRMWSDKLKQIYNAMINELQKQQSDNMKQMETQILKDLVKNLSIEKGVLEKIQNRRYERVRCHQLLSFMEQSNIQQKIKNSGHIRIYRKYEKNILSFKQIFDKFSSKFIESKSVTNVSKPQKVIQNQDNNFSWQATPGVQIINNQNTDKYQSQYEMNKMKILEEKYKLLEKEHKIIEKQYQKKKYEISFLNTEKRNLQRQLVKKNNPRIPKLNLKTWNIFKLSTRKIKKTHKFITIQQQQQNIQKNKFRNESSIQIEDSDEELNQRSQKVSELPSQQVSPQQYSQDKQQILFLEDNHKNGQQNINKGVMEAEIQQQQTQKIAAINLQQTRILQSMGHRPVEKDTPRLQEESMIAQKTPEFNNQQQKEIDQAQNRSHNFENNENHSLKQNPAVFQTPEQKSHHQQSNGQYYHLGNNFQNGSQQLIKSRTNKDVLEQKQQSQKKDSWFLSYFRKK